MCFILRVSSLVKVEPPSRLPLASGPDMIHVIDPRYARTSFTTYAQREEHPEHRHFHCTSTSTLEYAPLLRLLQARKYPPIPSPTLHLHSRPTSPKPHHNDQPTYLPDIPLSTKHHEALRHDPGGCHYHRPRGSPCSQISPW
ncbi:hypothetical protein BCR34DRAFT_566224 [Clohesyomyces aquaticus]|uniref:Uncharacterized protein n=1 Tax=Clohesyomyces aquaticus TaxID=1231657 RepID=A0A1Y1ZKQ6_9PLEO|nr:hypothetical protein BCR34DRAFT_566224 [Clohesyomyces aquaticus]